MVGHGDREDHAPLRLVAFSVTAVTTFYGYLGLITRTTCRNAIRPLPTSRASGPTSISTHSRPHSKLRRRQLARKRSAHAAKSALIYRLLTLPAPLELRSVSKSNFLSVVNFRLPHFNLFLKTIKKFFDHGFRQRASCKFAHLIVGFRLTEVQIDNLIIEDLAV
jgi:hypothetical protein